MNHPEVDLVSVVTPPNTHQKVLQLTLTAGKHLLCEKPAALTVEQAEQMVQLANNFKTHFCFMDHELRFLPSVNRMRYMVQSGKVGKIIHMEARITSGSRLHNRVSSS